MSYCLDRDELLRIRDLKLLTSDRDYLFFALQIDYPDKPAPTLDVAAFCERWGISDGNLYKALGELHNKGIVVSIANRLDLKFGNPSASQSLTLECPTMCPRIHYWFHNLSIPAAQTAAALTAINAMFLPERMAQAATTLSYDRATDTIRPSYRGVFAPIAGSFNSMTAALRAWSFESKLHRGGGLTIVRFMQETAGDEGLLFAVLAPFLDQELQPRVEAYQSDGQCWRHCFEAGIHRVVRGKVVYEEQDNTSLK